VWVVARVPTKNPPHAAGEGIFFAGLKHAAIRVVASYTEDQLITSDPKQLLEIEKAKRKFEKEMGEKKT